MIFQIYIPSSSSPKEQYLISQINTTAIESSNKPNMTWGGGNIILVVAELISF